jgi:hypothetical protein
MVKNGGGPLVTSPKCLVQFEVGAEGRGKRGRSSDRSRSGAERQSGNLASQQTLVSRGYKVTNSVSCSIQREAAKVGRWSQLHRTEW